MRKLESGYEALRDAIYAQAAEDYRDALRFPKDSRYERASIEKFLTSGAYGISSELGRYIMEECQRTWKEENYESSSYSIRKN